MTSARSDAIEAETLIEANLNTVGILALTIPDEVIKTEQGVALQFYDKLSQRIRHSG